MKNHVKTIGLVLAVPFLLMADLSPDAPLGFAGVREAAAIVGAPMTPVSYAGVARRTTRRVVATETAVVVGAEVAASEQKAAAAQQQAAAAQQQAQAARPPAGAVVSALPPGCGTAVKDGVQYYNCSGVTYRTAFQGNNLVYVVQ
jgi:hypothetical protein